MTPRHLILVVDNTQTGLVADAPLAPVVSVHRLAACVVAAAQRWAAEMDRIGAPLDVATEEQRAQRDLMDAVYDLEFHQSTPGARPDHRDAR